jgi:hypothetical protein
LLGEGRSARSVAVELALSEDAVQRHAKQHAQRQVPVVPTPAAQPPPKPTRNQPAVPAGDPLDELVTALRVRALAGNPTDTREYRLALAAQSDAKHTAPPQRELATEPEWIELRTRMLVALEPFAEARAAVVAALGEAG